MVFQAITVGRRQRLRVLVEFHVSRTFPAKTCLASMRNAPTSVCLMCAVLLETVALRSGNCFPVCFFGKYKKQNQKNHGETCTLLSDILDIASLPSKGKWRSTFQTWRLYAFDFVGSGFNSRKKTNLRFRAFPAITAVQLERLGVLIECHVQCQSLGVLIEFHVPPTFPAMTSVDSMRDASTSLCFLCAVLFGHGSFTLKKMRSSVFLCEVKNTLGHTVCFQHDLSLRVFKVNRGDEVPPTREGCMCSTTLDVEFLTPPPQRELAVWDSYLYEANTIVQLFSWIPCTSLFSGKDMLRFHKPCCQQGSFPVVQYSLETVAFPSVAFHLGSERYASTCVCFSMRFFTERLALF